MPLEPQDRKSTEFKSHHVWSQFVFGTWDEIFFLLGPAIPLYLFFWAHTTSLLMKRPIKWLKAKIPLLKRYLSLKGGKPG